MPVLVIGVESGVGGSVVSRLVRGGGQVRVFVDAGRPGSEATVNALRGIGCKVAHGLLHDEGHLDAAMTQTHTVMFLTGAVGDDPDLHLERASTMLAAAQNSGVKRLILLSDLAVPSSAGNEWLEALRDIEALAADAKLESVMVRPSVILVRGERLEAALRDSDPDAWVGGRHWPVSLSDVAPVVIGADERRTDLGGLHIVIPIASATSWSPTEMASLLGDERASEWVTPPAVIADYLQREVERPADAILGEAFEVVEDDDQ